MLLTCLTDIERHLGALHLSDDPEGPHGARVALRRLRSVLWGFRPMLRERVALRKAHEARVLFRAIGRLRDADVLALDAARVATSSDAVAAARAADLAEAAAQERRDLRVALQRLDAAGFVHRSRRLWSGPPGRWCKRGAKGRKLRKGPVARPARTALRAAWRAACGHGRKLRRMPADERHGLRKDLKRLRYLSEFGAGLFPGATQNAFLRDLRALQEDLGILNDLETAASRLGPKAVAAQRQRRQAALRDADAAWSRLRKAPPWW